MIIKTHTGKLLNMAQIQSIEVCESSHPSVDAYWPNGQQTEIICIDWMLGSSTAEMVETARVYIDAIAAAYMRGERLFEVV